MDPTPAELAAGRGLAAILDTDTLPAGPTLTFYEVTPENDPAALQRDWLRSLKVGDAVEWGFADLTVGFETLYVAAIDHDAVDDDGGPCVAVAWSRTPPEETSP